LLALSMTAFAAYSAQAGLWALPGRFLTGASAAAGIAMINAVGNLGGYLGPYGVGRIKESTGSMASALYFLAAVLALVPIMTFFVRRVIEREVGD